MKCKLILLLSLLPFCSRAQHAAPSDSLAGQLLNNLMDTWTLGVDSNNNTVDIAIYNKYKSLFDAGATVDDDLNIQLQPGVTSGKYVVVATTVDFDVYAHDIAMQVSKLRVDSAGLPRRIYVRDSLVYEVERTLYVEKPAKFLFADADKLALAILSNHPDIRFEKGGRNGDSLNRQEIFNLLRAKLQQNPDGIYRFVSSSILRIVLVSAGPDAGGQLKILSIRQTGNVLTCINDVDNDGVRDAGDSMPQTYGELTAGGAPDEDLDGVTDAADRCLSTYGNMQNSGCPQSYFVTNFRLDGALGLQLNSARFRLPQLNETGYRDQNGTDLVDVQLSKNGDLRIPPAAAGLFFGGSFTLYFGRDARRLGLSAGFGYARFNASYELSTPSVYTYKAFDSPYWYRRQVTVSSLREDMSLNVISIPLQLNYRFKPAAFKDWVLTLRGGPSLSFFTGYTDSKLTYDIGGLYQVNSEGSDIVYSDYFDPESDLNIYMSANGVGEQHAHAVPQSIFDKLNSSGGYDFMAKSEKSGRENLSRLAVTLACSIDGEYRRNPNSPVALKVGVHLQYAPLIGSRERYRPLAKSSDNYSSVFNSNGRSSYFAFGLALGLAYNF